MRTSEEGDEAHVDHLPRRAGLFATPPAHAKFVLQQAEACGAPGCRTAVAKSNRGLPGGFELLGPALERGRRTDAPPHPQQQSRYRVELTRGRDAG